MKIKKMLTYAFILLIIIAIIWYFKNRNAVPNNSCTLNLGSCSQPTFTAGTESSSPCPLADPTEATLQLNKGDSGCAVFQLQVELNKRFQAKGCSTQIAEEGWFGCETQAAVKYFINKNSGSINEITNY